MCAILGAGYTGLWTAYYLKQARPAYASSSWSSEFAGFGASGRNGGWLTNEHRRRPRRYAEDARRATSSTFSVR